MAASDTGGAYVQEGHILTLTRSSDSSLDGFILTADRFRNMKEHLGVTTSYLARGSGSNKSTSARVTNKRYVLCGGA